MIPNCSEGMDRSRGDLHARNMPAMGVHTHARNVPTGSNPNIK